MIHTFVERICPNVLNVSYNVFSSISVSKLPINKLAPTSYVLLSYDALLTLIGFPNNFIICMILIA